MKTAKTARVAEIVSLRTIMVGMSLYDCIMAVVDVSELDNDEIAALDELICNRDDYKSAVSCSPKLGEFDNGLSSVIRGVS